VAFLVLSLASIAGVALAEPIPDGLELLARAPSTASLHYPAAATADSSAIVGTTLIGSFWHATVARLDGFVVLPAPGGGNPAATAIGTSADAAFVAGAAPSTGDLYAQAVVWRFGVPAILPSLLPVGGAGEAADVSADGRVVVGSSRSTASTWWKRKAVRWVDGRPDALPVPPDTDRSEAKHVSDDGSVIVGSAILNDGKPVLLRWRGDQLEVLPDAPGRAFAFQPRWLSSSGEIVGGIDGDFTGGAAAFVGPDGWVVLDDLPTGRSQAEILSGSDDGGIMTGNASTGAASEECRISNTCPDVAPGFVWTPRTGTRPLKDLLVHGCGYALEPWTIESAWVSRDGRHVVFSGVAPGVAAGYWRASIEGCRFDHRAPEIRPEAGSLLVAMPRTHSIYHITPAGHVELFASHGLLQWPADLELGPGRTLYVLSGNAWDRLLTRIDLDTGESTIVTQGGLITRQQDLALDRDGVPYVLHSDGVGGSRLVRVDPASGEQSLAAIFPTSPDSVEREPDGALAVLLRAADRFELYRFHPSTGAVEKIASGGTTGRPDGLVVAPSGEIFAGLDADSFLRIDPRTGVATRVATGPLRHRRRPLDLDLEGRLLFWELPAYFMVRADPDDGQTSIGYGSTWFSEIDPHAAVLLRTECSDGFDNDLDGGFDHPEDRGCSSPDDDSEGFRSDVAIEVLPARDDNRVQLVAHAPIRLAILGSATVDPFAIDPETLTLGPGRALPRQELPIRRDVDRDGFLDLVLSFEVETTAVGLGDTELCLSGELEDDAFRACDEIDADLPGRSTTTRRLW
jgi:hypothetical protein